MGCGTGWADSTDATRRSSGMAADRFFGILNGKNIILAGGGRMLSKVSHQELG
jgi:hypothetical protein